MKTNKATLYQEIENLWEIFKVEQHSYSLNLNTAQEFSLGAVTVE